MTPPVGPWRHLVRRSSGGLRGNPIAKLPDELCALASLGDLDLSHTNITALPDDFGRLASLLDSLYLHGTRLRSAVIARIRTTFPSCDMWNFS